MADNNPGVEKTGETEQPALSITFIVATLDEERFIGPCLDSLLAQDYPADKIRVIVVDGGSVDRTRQIVEGYQARDPRVSLLHNPRKIAAAAFNLALSAMTTDVGSITSAHAETDPSFARSADRAFRESGADLVGGRCVAVVADATPTAEAIVLATSSPLGVGGSRHHYSEEPGWVDTAYPSAYRRSLVERIGLFDEELVRNQDDDYHLRAALSGSRMWFDPRLRAEYHPRPTLRTLWWQYFDYGYWRFRTLRKHRRVASARQLAPAALVAGIFAGPVLWKVRPIRRIWIAGIEVYLLGLAAGSFFAADRPGMRHRFASAVMVLHVAYGCGFWASIGSSLIRSVPRLDLPHPKGSGATRL